MILIFNPVITSINEFSKEVVDLKLFIQSVYISRQHCDFMLNIANTKNINKVLNCMPQMGIVLFPALFLLCLKFKVVTEKKKKRNLRLQVRKCHVLGSGKFKVMLLHIRKHEIY